MLALSRKINESVVIGDNIRIIIVDVRGDKVRLGIEAPADVAIFRSEVFEKIQKERETAARVAKNRESQAIEYAQTVDFAKKILALGTDVKNKNVAPNASDSTDRSAERIAKQRRIVSKDSNEINAVAFKKPKRQTLQ